MQVHEVMSRQVRVVSPNDTIQKAAKLMSQTDCGAIPVGENDRLVGMVTDRDVAVRGVAQGKTPNQCKVREVMSNRIRYVFDDETTEAAAESMSRLQVRRLPVLNREKRLVGIVSLGDLATKHGIPVAGNALREISKPTASA
jgi:CBS domain-containing protein